MILISITEVLLYIGFSFLIGSLILSMVPADKKPSIYIPKIVFILSAVLIPIAAFLPVFQTAKILAGDMDLWFILQSVLLTFEIGQAWLFIAIVSIILLCVLMAKSVTTNKNVTVWALALTFLMLLAYTRSSHAATITEWQGFLFHTLHFLAVTIWIGILLTVSWFSKNKNNWMSFLKWFTPLAITCLIITIVAGYFTMEIDINSYDDPNASMVQEYSNSLMVNYGQALFIKHLFIISLVLFAIFNGILFRKKASQNSFNPLKWTRLESVFALVVFGVTAFMGQSWPPHQIYTLINAEGPSPFFEAIYDGGIINTIQSAGQTGIFNVSIDFGFESYLLFGLSLLFMGITIFAAVKKMSVFATTFASLFMLVAAYFGVMIGIQ